MIGIIVTGHGNFATGLGSSLKLITGLTEGICLVDFEEDHTTDILGENIEKAMEELKEADGIVVLSDLPGGSPFKTAVECKYRHTDRSMEVLSGISLPMLIEGSMMKDDFDDVCEFARELMEIGKNYIVRFQMEERDEETEEEGI